MRRELSKKEEERLVREAAAGSGEAFDALVHQYAGLVYAIAFARLRSREAAEDLVQEVFVRIYLNLGKLTEPKYFGTWASRIARNLSMDWVQREQRASALMAMVPLDSSTVAVNDLREQEARATLEERERAESVRLAIEDLPVEQREIILLHFAEGLTLRQIAELLEVHPTTAGRQLETALNCVRDKVVEPLLRDSSRRLGASRQLVSRTAAAAGVVALMSGHAKSALASAAQLDPALNAWQPASASKWTTLLKSLAGLGVSGSKGAIVTKAIVAAGAIMALTSGGYYALVQSGETSPASAPSSSRPTAALQNDPSTDWAVGTWIGTITFPGASRQIYIVYQVKRKSDGTLSALAQSPDQGFASIPVDTVEIDHDRFHLANKTLRADYDAKPKGSHEVTGTFRQNKDVLPLTMTKAKSSPASVASPIAVPAEKLQDFAGRYAYGPTTTASITLEGDTLFAHSMMIESDRLIPISENEFRLSDNGGIAIFGRDGAGKVDRVTFRVEFGDFKRDHNFRKLQ